jgi:hypothetical protein
MTRAEEAAWEAYPYNRAITNNDVEYDGNFCNRLPYIEGYEQSQQDIIALIQSRIDGILGDAQPAPILRMELQELIKKIES